MEDHGISQSKSDTTITDPNTSPAASPEGVSEEEDFANNSPAIQEFINESEIIDGQSENTRLLTTSESGVSTHAKDGVKTRDGWTCWACGAEEPLQVCHVISKADVHAFRKWHRAGILGFFKLGDENNLLTLCATCHSFFDGRPVIGLVILPTSLNLFVEKEKENFMKRQIVYELRGIKLRRRIPNPGALGFDMSYTRYCVFDGFNPSLSIVKTAPMKNWSGSPGATICKAMHALALGGKGIPESTLRTLLDLQLLYLKEPWEKVRILNPLPPTEEADERGYPHTKDDTSSDTQAGKNDILFGNPSSDFPDDGNCLYKILRNSYSPSEVNLLLNQICRTGLDTNQTAEDNMFGPKWTTEDIIAFYNPL